MNKYWLLLFSSVIIASFSQILLKKSAQKKYGTIIKEYLNFNVILGYGMMVLTTLLTIMAYKGLDYKNGPIIEALGYILVMFLSLIFFGEKITKKKFIGNMCILLGIFIFYC